MSEAFTRLRDLVAYLRSDKGCPWDREQTLDSLKPHLLEEMHEACEAIEEDNTGKIREELGDVLFVARIAEEEGRFSLDEVMDETCAKMRQRHPHVFGERRDMDPDQVLDVWERAKQEQKPEGESVLSGVPKGLPALIKAQRIQQRAASLGFDWKEVKSAFEKLKEEIDEFEHARQHEDIAKITDEMGDILFSLVNVSRFLGIRAEDALQGTIEKFRNRFKKSKK